MEPNFYFQMFYWHMSCEFVMYKVELVLSSNTTIVKLIGLHAFLVCEGLQQARLYVNMIPTLVQYFDYYHILIIQLYLSMFPFLMK
jgi:hypothetical protein